MINNFAVNLHKEYMLSLLNLGNEYVGNEIIAKIWNFTSCKVLNSLTRYLAKNIFDIEYLESYCEYSNYEFKFEIYA